MPKNKFTKPGDKRRSGGATPAKLRAAVLRNNPAGVHSDDKQSRPAKRAKTSHHESARPNPAASAPPQQDEAPQTVAKSVETDYDVATELSGDRVDALISTTHKVMELRVISSSQIKRKVTQILSHLATFSFVDLDAKPVMILVRADGAAVSKAISIVEITKSELSNQNAKWYQYSMVQSHTVELPRAPAKGGEASGRTISQWEKQQVNTIADKAAETGDLDLPAVEMNDGGDEPEEAFEVMQQCENGVNGLDLSRPEQAEPTQTVPRLVLLLTRVRCEPARIKYGEQTNAPN